MVNIREEAEILMEMASSKGDTATIRLNAYSYYKETGRIPEEALERVYRAEKERGRLHDAFCALWTLRELRDMDMGE